MKRRRRPNTDRRPADFNPIPDLPETPENHGPQKKKVMRPFEWFMLFTCVAIVGLVCLHEGGISLIKKTETVEIVERPIENRKKATSVRYRDEDIDRNVDQVLKDIAREFSDEGEGKKRVSKRDLRKKGLDKQEAEYINQVKKEQKEKGTLENAKDWYNVLKTSHETYSKVKGVFNNATGQEEATVDKGMIRDILENDMLSNTVFSQIEEKFNIPKERSEAFAKAGKKQLDDWAAFVEANKAN